MKRVVRRCCRVDVALRSNQQFAGFGRGAATGCLSWALRPRLHAAVPLGPLFALLLVFVPMSMADDSIGLDCTPRAFKVVPGEPIRLQLTVHADSAVPVRWHIPDDSLLKLRAIEKLPVRRTREGVVVYQRVVVWQGLEPGAVTINTLSVKTKGQKLPFPSVSIAIRDPVP